MQISKPVVIIAFFSLFGCNQGKDWSEVVQGFRQRGLPNTGQPVSLVGYSFSAGDANGGGSLELCDNNVAFDYQIWVEGDDYICGHITRGKWSIGEDKNIYFEVEANCPNIAKDQELCAISECVATPPSPYHSTRPSYELTSADWKLLEKEKWSSLFRRTGGNLSTPPFTPGYFSRYYSNETKLCFNNSLKTLAYERQVADGIKLYREGKNTEAKQVLMQALTTPLNNEPYYYLGNVNMNLHEYQEAIRNYRKSYQWHYERYNSVFNIACAYSLLHDAKNATRYLLFNYTHGDSDLQRVMTDPDLQFFRESADFADFQKQVELIDSGVEPDPPVEIDWYDE